MSDQRTIAQVEADLAALKAAADRAGLALACVFWTSDEFEAAAVQRWRETAAISQGANRGASGLVATAILATMFLLL